MKTANPPPAAGFTLVEVMIVVAIIALLSAIAIPNYVRARADAQANTCINTLRQIESACQQIDFSKGLAPGATITYPDDVMPFIKLNNAGSVPPCPAGGQYSVAPVGVNPQAQCSLSNSVSPPHVLP